MTLQLSAKLITSAPINLYYNDTFITTLTNTMTDYLFSVPDNAILSAWNSQGLFSDPLTTSATIAIKNKNSFNITVESLNSEFTPEEFPKISETIKGLEEQGLESFAFASFVHLNNGFQIYADRPDLPEVFYDSFLLQPNQEEKISFDPEKKGYRLGR